MSKTKTILKNVMKTDEQGKREWIRYRKRAIIDIGTWIGWDRMLSLIDSCNQVPYDVYFAEFCRERDKGLVSALFLTGGRVSEVLGLTRDNFDFQPKKYCVVSNMLLSKRFLKTGEYTEKLYEEPRGCHAKLYKADTEKVEGKIIQVWMRKRWRTTITSEKVRRLRVRKPFPILKKEPLYPILENYVKKSHSDLLFPSSRLRKNGTRNMTATNAWIIINRIQNLTGIELWPHWFRSQRASQLKKEYGFNSDDRKDWFSWESDPMADLYAKTSPEDMAAKMLRV